jgi:molybdate transport system substrate-binding protein
MKVRRWAVAAILALAGALIRTPQTLAAQTLAAQIPAAQTPAAQIRLAVAANFTLPMKQQIVPAFQQETGHTVLATYGPTGGLYAQIVQGAPFDALLAADAERPQQLEASGLGVAGTRFTFALGKVVLWSATPGLVDANGAVLEKGNFDHLALPNPKIAPYGRAAREVLRALVLWDTLEPKVVYGQDLNQTYQLIASGNAALGFVALSQVKASRPGDPYWLPDAALHAPIEQQAILLTRSRDSAAARAFLAFLRSPKGRALIESFGYGVE